MPDQFQSPDAIPADVLDTLLRLLAAVGVPQSYIKKLDVDTDLLDEGVFDSVSLVNFAIKVEPAFQITIPPKDLDPVNFVTLRAVSLLIARRRSVDAEPAAKK